MYQNIFEFDLRKCFDRIRLDKLKKIMIKQGVPERIASYFYRLSMSPPIFEYFAQDESQYLNRGRPVEVNKSPIKLYKAVSFKTADGRVQKGYTTINGKVAEETQNPD